MIERTWLDEFVSMERLRTEQRQVGKQTLKLDIKRSTSKVGTTVVGYN